MFGIVGTVACGAETKQIVTGAGLLRRARTEEGVPLRSSCAIGWVWDVRVAPRVSGIHREGACIVQLCSV